MTSAGTRAAGARPARPRDRRPGLGTSARWSGSRPCPYRCRPWRTSVGEHHPAGSVRRPPGAEPAADRSSAAAVAHAPVRARSPSAPRKPVHQPRSAAHSADSAPRATAHAAIRAASRPVRSATRRVRSTRSAALGTVVVQSPTCVSSGHASHARSPWTGFGSIASHPAGSSSVPDAASSWRRMLPGLRSPCTSPRSAASPGRVCSRSTAWRHRPASTGYGAAGSSRPIRSAAIVASPEATSTRSRNGGPAGTRNRRHPAHQVRADGEVGRGRQLRLTQARPWPQAAQQERPVVRVGAEQLDHPRTGPGGERGGLVAGLEVRVRELEDDVVACRRRGRRRPRRHARVEGLADDEGPALASHASPARGSSRATPARRHRRGRRRAGRSAR